MGAIVELLLFTVLCVSVGGVQGVCRNVPNQDLIEYSCEGGWPSDLDDLPKSTSKIVITNMPIPRITVDTFSRFGSDLWVLSCIECQIRDIEPGAFQRLDNLQQLTLSNNHLTTVKESWFRGLNYLTFLDLNYNEIESIEEGVFRNLPGLIDLRLSGNRLECLNLNDMMHLIDLKRIFLGENPNFKCPHAVTAFLKSRQLTFDQDPEWSKIPYDLVRPPVNEAFDYDIDEETPEPITQLPIHRERLHPTTQPPPPVESTATYVPPKFYTTEDVVYRPVYTPDWRTTPREPTTRYEERVEYSTMRPYVPPQTVAPVTYPSYETTWYKNEDATTFRSWPTFWESTSARPEFSLNPVHEDEDTNDEDQYYLGEVTDMYPLASSPPSHHETPPFVESDLDRTTPSFRAEWNERNTIPSVDGPPEYRAPPTSDTASNHVVQPMPPATPEMVHPASPDNTFQVPYYEVPMSVHPSPAVPIETTTDKPLPDCPTRNSSWRVKSSLRLLLVSIILAALGRLVVEGF